MTVGERVSVKERLKNQEVFRVLAVVDILLKDAGGKRRKAEGGAASAFLLRAPKRSYAGILCRLSADSTLDRLWAGRH